MILSGREPRINSPGEITGLEPMLHQDKNIVATSIVRGDNHFIRISGKWILIDGSWFDTLNSQYSFYVEEIRYSSTGSLDVILNMQEYDQYVPVRIVYVSWRRVLWYRRYACKEFPIIDSFGVNWYTDWKPGWMCDGGVLPCHLHSVAYNEQIFELEDLNENTSRDRIRRAGFRRGW